MKDKNLLQYTLPALLVALLFLFGTAEAVDYGDAIVSASIADARTLMPILASDSASSDITSLIFNGLVKYDKDINLVGDLAEKWDISEGGRVIIFYLRKGVRWHDGVEFTAEDVKFTFEKLIDPQVRTPYSGDFKEIESLEIIDKYTVKIRYKQPFAPGLASWGMSIIPKHILEKQDINNTSFSRHPIGTGPYKLKKWKTQEKIELIANEDYFEHKPFISRSITRVIPDSSTIFLELQTQAIDTSGLSPLQFSRQTDTNFFKKYYRKFRLPGFNYTYLGYNLRRPLFNDVRVRQALNLAVDKKEIIDMVLLGFGSICTGPFVPQSWAYNNNIKPKEFNPQEAKRILNDLGWQDTDNDGWLDKDKKVFEFTIVTNQGNEERLKVAQIIQRRLKDIGIKVKIRVAEWSVFLNEVVDARNFDAVLLGWSVPREPDIFDIWHSSKTRPGEFNFIGYQNTEVDDLLEQARRTFDQNQRAQCYRRIHQIIYEEQPYMFLFSQDALLCLHKRFQGVEPASIGIGYNFIDWWVPKKEQRYRILP
ncbi:MAG: peptide-binding protein [Candidatus Omnitrophica bacterium]|nr:peptide-binding protein [Candidatus Omnitrophota bacterium]